MPEFITKILGNALNKQNVIILMLSILMAALLLEIEFLRRFFEFSKDKIPIEVSVFAFSFISVFIFDEIRKLICKKWAKIQVLKQEKRRKEKLEELAKETYENLNKHEKHCIDDAIKDNKIVFRNYIAGAETVIMLSLENRGLGTTKEIGEDLILTLDTELFKMLKKQRKKGAKQPLPEK